MNHAKTLKQRPIEWETIHIPRNAAPQTYFCGDKARYTGRATTLSGGYFYEIEMLEGHLKGQMRVTTAAPQL